MAMLQTKFSDNSICEMENSTRKKPNMLKKIIFWNRQHSVTPSSNYDGFD